MNLDFYPKHVELLIWVLVSKNSPGRSDLKFDLGLEVLASLQSL